jgi:hypothetical protein
MALSNDPLGSDCWSGGINWAVDVYRFGINNAMPIDINMPNPITLASQNRRCHSAIRSSVSGISIESAASSSALRLCSSAVLNVSSPMERKANSAEIRQGQRLHRLLWLDAPQLLFFNE